MASLADCFAKFGKALDGKDRRAIQARVDAGETPEQAVANHMETLDQAIDSIAIQVERQGGKVERLQQSYKPAWRVARSLMAYSGVERAVEEMDIPAWKSKKGQSFPFRIKVLDSMGQVTSAGPETFDTLEEAEAYMAERDMDPGSGFFAMQDPTFDLSANGADIWAKLKKMPGVKKEELEWIGVEDFLKAGDKFTRADVLAFVRSNGVQVEETVAGTTQPEDQAVGWSDEQVYDDPEAWQHMQEDRENYPEDFGADLQSMRTEVIIEILAEEEAYIDQALGPIDQFEDQDSLPLGIPERDLENERVQFVEREFATEIEDRVQRAVQEWAEESAEREYRQNPYVWYEMTVEGDNTDIYIFGNDDIGWDIRHGGIEYYHRVSGLRDNIWSASEAQIEAEEWVRDNPDVLNVDLGVPEEDEARWDAHVVDGPHDNYREIKLKLPGLIMKSGKQAQFYKTSHFPDENIVAFLRVTDRDLSLPDRELTPEEAKDFTPPEYTQRLEEWEKNFETEEYQRAKERSETAVKEAIAYLVESDAGLEESFSVPDDPRDHQGYISGTLHNEAHNQLDPQNRDYGEPFATGVNAHGEGIRDVNRRFYDWTAEATAVHNYFRDREFQRQQIDRLYSNANTQIAKRRRAGIQDKQTFFIDELQSDWHQQGRQSGYRLRIGGADAMDADAQSMRDKAFEVYNDNLHPDDMRSLVNLVVVAVNGDTGLSPNEKQARISRWRQMGPMTVIRLAIEGGSLDSWTMPSATRSAVIKEMMNLSSENENIAEIVRLVDEAHKLEKTALAEREGVDDAPFKGDAWLALGVKRAVAEAVKEGYGALAWPNAAEFKKRWGDTYSEMYDNQYDKKMPSIIRKLTGKKPIQIDETGAEIGTFTENDVLAKEYHDEDGVFGGWNFWLPSRPDIDREFVSDQMDYGLQLEPPGRELTFDEARGVALARFNRARRGMWAIDIDIELQDRVNNEGFPLFQRGKRPRGFFDPERNRITFTKNADLSTFVHEAAHFFLEVMRDLAPHAPEIQRDLATLEAWWAANGAANDTARHEMFASGQEQYLLEGNAPVPELEPMFARFRGWLTLVYRWLLRTTPFGANNMPDVELTDEVRRVFDRLIASEDEIAQAAQQQGRDALPVDQMGLPEGEAAQYARTRAEARQAAETEVAAKVMADLQRERDRWWKQGVEDYVADITVEWNEKPEYIARDFLTGDRVPDGSRGAKIDSRHLRRVYGDEAANRLARGRMTTEGGVSVNALAPQFGFDTGQDMVVALLGTLNKAERRKAIKAEAEARMRQEHGDIVLDGTLNEEAQRALHGEKQAKVIALELKLINQRLGPGFVSRGTPRQQRAIYRAAAERAMRDRPFDDIKPSVYLRNEQKFARMAIDHAARDEWAQARDAKQKQLRNFYAYRAALDARENTTKIQRRLRQMQTAKYSARQVDANYISAMKVLLAAFDLRKTPKQSDELLGRVNAFIAAQKQAVETETDDLIAGDLITSVRSWRKMTLEELQAVRDAAENLLKVGKENSDVERRRHNLMVDGLEASIKDKAGAPRNLPRNKSTIEQARRGMGQFFSAHHRKLESFLQELDGWVDNGPMQQAIFKPLWDAQIEEIRRGQEEHAALGEIFDGFEYLFNGFQDNLQSLGIDKGLDLHKMPTMNGASLRLSRGQRIVLALNWGNEGNREALRNQKDAPLSDEAVMEAIETLTEEELQLVNRLWNYVDKFYPELAKVEQKATGVAPRKVEADPFEVNGVTMRGGYYPLHADTALSLRAEMLAVADRAEKLKMGGAARASSKHGSTIERKNFAGMMVDLQIEGLFRHVDGVLHDITHREAVQKIDRILRDPRVSAAGQASIGMDNYKAISGAVVRLAGGATHPSDLDALTRFARFSRIAASYGAMGYSTRTSLLNLTGFLPALAEIGKVRFVSALVEQLSAPLEFGADIVGKSVFMKNRGETITRDVWEIARNMRGNTTWNNFKQHAFWMLTKVDALISRSVWRAAYDQALANNMSEEQAIYEADRTVSRTQGTGLKIDLSAVEDSNEIVRALSPMYTYFNAVLNLSIRRYGKMRAGEISKARWLQDMFWIFVATALLEEAMFGYGDDEEEQGETTMRYLRQIPLYFAGQWFGIRELSGLVEYGKTFETPLQRTVTAPVKLGTELSDLVFDEDAEFDKGTWRATTDVLPLLGFPSGAQVNRMGKYLMELEEEGGDFSPIGFLVTGRHDEN